MGRGKTKKKLSELEPVTDPKAELDSALFLRAATPVLKQLKADLLARAEGSKAVSLALQARHQADKAARRTGDSFVQWKEHFVEQVAAAWLLSCVFVRTLEDRGLLGRARIAGPGAMDSQKLFFELGPSLSERDYLLTVFRELSRFSAAEALFDARHNPVWLLAPSAEAAKALLALFRSPESRAPAFRFGQPDTRFLGDLYQDLDEGVRKRFALLQTPRFVESFILDRTLERAIERFGLDDTTLIDPTCGSGHFLLGAFERFYRHRLEKEPGLDQREAARKALDAVHGADINPYAVAIARFRLTLAFLETAGFERLTDAPRLPLHLAVADSLLHNPQLEQQSFALLEGQSAAAWSGEEYALEDERAAREVLHRRYAAVVGNPPYINVKDAVLRKRYAELYSSCRMNYALTVPFAERFFHLARPSGAVGMITANSFMKREFGKALIESFLPSVNLDFIVNTSGAYIPGHGTPTVLLFGAMEAPQGSDLLTVLAKRGEPTTPEDAEEGHVWRSIADHFGEVGFENDYVSVAHVDRDSLAQHPWSLGGGGASELKALLEERASKTLSDVVDDIGFSIIIGEDEIFIRSAGRAQWADLPTMALVIGEQVRDWGLETDLEIVRPFDLDTLEVTAPEALQRHLWPWRRVLEKRIVSGSTSMKQANRQWFDVRRLSRDKHRWPLSITFAFVATHNHFVLDRGGKVFKQSAPIIKLPEDATEDDHLALLAYLNSSTACFWMKQVFHDKGGGTDSGGWQDDPSKSRYEFAGTGLASIPLPEFGEFRGPACKLARLALEIAERRATRLGASLERPDLPLSTTLREGEIQDATELRRLIAIQEELDWLVYAAFGLCSKSLVRQWDLALDEQHDVPLGGRAYEMELARQGVSVGTDGQRYLAEPPTTWGAEAQETWKQRREALPSLTQVALIESSEFKRRWAVTPKELGGAVVSFRHRARSEVLATLDRRLEQVFASAARSQAGPLSLRKLSHLAEDDGRIAELAHAYAGGDASAVLSERMDALSVPFLPCLLLKPSALAKHTAWQKVWALQRREDAGHKVGRIAVPPRFAKADYQRSTYWELRGKLDVPKERFISYPGCESDEDGEPVYGWAGWNHLERAQALAALYQERKNEGWQADPLTPMLAGLLELVPWVKQWHNEPSEEFGGLKLGDYFDAFIKGECSALGLTEQDLRDWRPPEKKRGKSVSKKRTQKSKSGREN